MFQERQWEPCKFGTFLGMVLKFRRGNLLCSSVSLMNTCPVMVEKRHPNTLQLFSWIAKCSLPKMKRTLLQAGMLLSAGIIFYHLYVRTISQKLNIKNANIHSGQLFWFWRTSASFGQWLTVCQSFFIQKGSSWWFLQGLLISVAITSLSTNILCIVIARSCEWLSKLLSGATSLDFERRNSFLSLSAPSLIWNHKSKFRSSSWFFLIDQAFSLTHLDLKNSVWPKQYAGQVKALMELLQSHRLKFSLMKHICFFLYFLKQQDIFLFFWRNELVTPGYWDIGQNYSAWGIEETTQTLSRPLNMKTPTIFQWVRKAP